MHESSLGVVNESHLAAWCTAAARDGVASFPSIAAGPEERDALVRVLLANRLGPALDRALTRGGVASAPNEFVDAIRRDARAAAERGLAGLAALRDVADALEAGGIPWMLWKGPALAMQVWGEATRRRFSDIDVVVPPASRAAALSALEHAGWRMRDALPARTAHAIHDGTRAYPLDRPGSLLVELHWAFAGRLYPTVARVEDVHARAERVLLAGREVRAPGGADALLLLATHATKHGWSQAEEVVSFARLSARAPDALAGARSAAASAGVPRVIALAERLVARLIAPIDTDVSTRTGTRDTRDARMIDLMADACIGRMLAGDGAWRETHAWSASWMSRPADRLRFRLGVVWRPTPQEWQWLALPPALAGAYPLVRVTRLALRSVGLTR